MSAKTFTPTAALRWVEAAEKDANLVRVALNYYGARTFFKLQQEWVCVDEIERSVTREWRDVPIDYTT